MTGLMQDLRYGVRNLARSPGLTLAAILALALAIGANTAIFSVVNAVLLRPLPYPDADHLLSVHQIWDSSPGEHDVLSTDDVVELHDGASEVLQSAAYYSPGGGLAVTGGGEPEQLAGTIVTTETFEILGVPPELGRSFLPEDGKPGAEPVVVLSHAFWQRRFGGDRGVVGSTLAIDSQAHTIVGVMPPEFRFPRDTVADLWPIFRPERSDSRPPYWIQAIARPRPGASPAAVERALQSVTRMIKERFPDSAADWRLDAALLKAEMVGNARPALLILLGAVALVLLIATANIANLLLARATARRKEMAIRAALGASWTRLARQLVTESLILAAAGGLSGILLAFWGTDLLVRLGPRNLPRLHEVGIDLRVLLYTAAVTILSGLLFGLAPATRSTLVGIAPALVAGVRGTTDRTGRRLRSLLVVGEFALAVMLLCAAGLLIRSFLSLQGVSPGFDSGGVLTASISLPNARYADGAARTALFKQLVERTERLPGVQAAAVSMSLPPNLLVMTNPCTVEGRPLPPGRNPPAVAQLLIGGDYFKALGVPLLRGRDFTPADTEQAPPVVIINQSMAVAQFRGEDPVGRRLQLGDPDPTNPWVTIVGVVADVRYNGLERASEPTMYTPYEQTSWWPTMYLLVRSSVDPAGLATGVRSLVAALDPLLPVSRVRTMDELLGQSVAEPRYRTTLLGIFAGVALLLATVGIYGVLSYTVGQRTQEIGIRMALGAQRRDILSVVLREGMALSALGVAIGLAGAAALSRVLSGLLFGVGPMDPATFGAVSGLMLCAAFAACYVPARRATRVDPLVALRAE